MNLCDTDMEVLPSINEWAERIREHLGRTVEAIVATGQELIAGWIQLPSATRGQHGDGPPVLLSPTLKEAS